MKRFYVLSLMTVRRALNEKLRNEIVYQIILWISLYTFGLFRSYAEYEQQNLREIFFYDICHWIFQVIGANLIYFVLIRKFFEAKRYALFAIYFIAALYILGVLNRIFIVYAAEPWFINEPQNSIPDILSEIKYLIFYYLLPIISGAFIFISMKFMLRYRDEKQNTLQLQKEKSELELKALKSQLNPHFLFNTLNNIYSLSVTGSAATSQSISQLSDLMDYILYKGQKEMVPIAEELKIVKDYIALEKLRYGDRLVLHILEKIELPGAVPPLLYLSFVENAFKHGAEKTSGTAQIKISVETNAGYAVFKVENQFFKEQQNKSVRIGLENIKKQLDLYYQHRYSLEIKQENNWFILKLMTPRNYD